MPHGTTVIAAANPEDGKVADGKYTNEYFLMDFPLPTGWRKDRDGPGPSRTGYYVLTALTGGGGPAGTMLMAAQDQFFADAPPDNPSEMVDRFGRELAPIDGMTIDRPLSEVTLAGRRFARLDFSGVGLFRTMLVTESRCHLISFNLTVGDPDGLASLMQSLNNLSFDEAPGRARSVPVCIKDYATPEHLRRRVEPVPVGPKFIPVPVRIIIGADGSVGHIHVINGSAEQRNSIARALAQWQFRPFVSGGRAAAVETGLAFRF